MQVDLWDIRSAATRGRPGNQSQSKSLTHSWLQRLAELDTKITELKSSSETVRRDVVNASAMVLRIDQIEAKLSTVESAFEETKGGFNCDERKLNHDDSVMREF